MTKTERQTLKEVRILLDRILSETILPELYEHGLISDTNTIDVKVMLRPSTKFSILKRMEVEDDNDP